MYFRNILIILLAVSLFGCTHYAKQAVVSPEFKSELGGKVFRSVHIQTDTYEGSGPRYVYRDYLPQIREKIASSGLFDLGLGSFEDRVTLNVYWTWNNNTNEWIDVARAATLFLIPNKADLDHKMKFEIVKRGRIIKTYEYEQNVQYITSLFTDNGVTGSKWFHEGVNSILRRFFTDLKKDGVLSISPDEQRQLIENSI